MNLFDNRYKKEDLIGRGAFSEVWRATDTYTNAVMALKIYTSSSQIDDDGLDMLKHEFALMIDADHQNLLRPLHFGVSAEGRLPYLTLPYCKGGNISKMMGRMTERDAWKLIRDTASALAYLHAMNPPIIHQDIKPANILIGNDGYYKLSDFGVSIHARSALSSKKANGESAYHSAGTISYMAPEKFSEDNLPIMANDIYSLGATVYEMLSGSLPFGVDGGLIQKKGADIPNLPGDYSMRLKQTIKDCLNAEPWERPTAVKLEEIAIDALSKAPTVIINSESSNQGLTQEELRNDYSFGTRVEPKKSKSLILIIGIIAVVLVVLALLFFLPKQEDKPEVITTERPQEPIASDPVESAEPPVQAIEQPEQKEEPPVQKVEPPVRMIEPATVVVTEKPQQSSKTLDLGYATWEGKSTNGKPDGYGTMIFHNAHRIDSRDDQGRVAQSGDKVKGNYINGHLEYGTWIKASGGQEEIFIGQ